MARAKQTVWQTDFRLGAIRPEAVEREASDLVLASTKEAVNCIGLTTGQIADRPGTYYLHDTTSDVGYDVDLGNGRSYDMRINRNGYVLRDIDDAIVTSGQVDWEGIGDYKSGYSYDDVTFWVVPSPDRSAIIIGSQFFDLQALVVDDEGVWSFGAFQYGQDPITTGFETSFFSKFGFSSQLLPKRPYFPHYPSVKLSISQAIIGYDVRSDGDLFTNEWVGLQLRIRGVEMTVLTFESATHLVCSVAGDAPRTVLITLPTTVGFSVGDVVEDATLGGQGIVTEKTGTVLTVFCLGAHDDFAAENELVGPSSTGQITSINDDVGNATFVNLWDMQMFSGIHGYPGCAAIHKDRFYLGNFPSSPRAFAVSIAGDISDFSAGADDGDGFVDLVGTDTGGDLKYIVSAEDLLFFTTRGIFYQSTRTGDAVTPSNIGPIPFSKIGCAGVHPIAVDDGAVFVDAIGEQVQAAVLSGDVYRSWRVEPVSKFHAHLFNKPKQLGATVWGSERPEQFIYVVNEDGTAAVCQWDRSDNSIGWRPWVTDGFFVSIYQSMSRVHAIVDRVIDGSERRTRERFEYGLYMDCCACVEVSEQSPTGVAGTEYFAGVTQFATHLEGHAAGVYLDGWDFGDLTVNSDGMPLDSNGDVLSYPTYAGIAQVGLPFAITVLPWPRRSVETQRGTRDVKRLIDLYVSVMATGLIEIDGQTVGAYAVGDDLTQPPALVDRQYRVAVKGGASFETTRITRSRPGPFLLTKIGQRVSV